jgi:hypothetical protein
VFIETVHAGQIIADDSEGASRPIAGLHKYLRMRRLCRQLVFDADDRIIGSYSQKSSAFNLLFWPISR